jgi:4-amino-4-deoxy-L-arabinose transferase-like glycosyltransferase
MADPKNQQILDNQLGSPAPRLAVWIYCLISIPLIFMGLDSYSVVNGDEAVYQDMAERMIDSGNWFKLMSGEEHRVYDTFMNAPIQYWVRGAIVTFLGPNLLSMRLHSAVFALGTVLLLYRLVLHVAGRRAAFLAGLIQLTTYQFIFLHGARTGELESGLCLLFVASALLFIRAIEDPRRGFILHHICFLLILNLKIPVVIVPTLAELLCFAALPTARPLVRRWVVTGLAVVPFGLVWHIYQAVHLGDGFWRVASEMQSQASTTNRFGQSRGGWYNITRYLPVVLYGTFPYALFFPIAAFSVLRRSFGSGENRERDRLWVLAFYALSVFVFYGLIAKRGAWYVMPAYPFLSAFLGIWLARLGRERIGDATLCAIAIALALSLWLVPEVINPFAHTAYNVAMRVGWREIAGVGAAIGAPVLAGLFLYAARLTLARDGLQPARILAVGLASLLIGHAGLRCLSSLQFLGTQSALGELRAEIDRAVEAGEELDFPVYAPPGNAWTIRYYFWRDFGLRRGPVDLETGNLLYRQLAYRLYDRRQMAEGKGKMPPPQVLNRHRR